jgi:hypothetical protein
VSAEFGLSNFAGLELSECSIFAACHAGRGFVQTTRLVIECASQRCVYRWLRLLSACSTWQLVLAQYQTSLTWSRPLGEVADGSGSSVAMSSIIA